MKVLHVIPSVSRTSGGPARSCQGLVAAECTVGIDAWLWPINGGEAWIEGVRVVKAPAIGDYDLVHVHGIWSPALHKVCAECRRQGVPYVIAPRGMLEPWSLKQKWLKKRIARWMYQDKDLHGAVALHATAESEAEQFKALGFSNPVIVSPNGVNVPKELPRAEQKSDTRMRILFMSRMHAKKGVMELVEAVAKVKGLCPSLTVELVYTMRSEEEKEYEKAVRQRVGELGLEGQFRFTGALDDEAKWEAYGRANLFVLPTYSENFGIVVAEALWAGLPVITTKGTPWGELETNGCGRWIELPPKESLASALVGLLNMPLDELKAMGERGRKLVEDRYLWSAVVMPMVAGYERIAGGKK